MGGGPPPGFIVEHELNRIGRQVEMKRRSPGALTAPEQSLAT